MSCSVYMWEDVCLALYICRRMYVLLCMYVGGCMSCSIYVWEDVYLALYVCGRMCASSYMLGRERMH